MLMYCAVPKKLGAIFLPSEPGPRRFGPRFVIPAEAGIQGIRESRYLAKTDNLDSGLRRKDEKSPRPHSSESWNPRNSRI